MKAPRRAHRVSIASRTRRPGLSLLEVVIATTILAGSLAILGQLIERGRRGAEVATFELDALGRCESIMAAACTELTTGVEVPDVLLEDGDFLSNVQIESTESETLQRVIVTTKHVNQRGVTTASVRLVRLVVPLPEEESSL